MGDYSLQVLAALWLGILTSISPCPLATNIAAISYVAGRADVPRNVLLSGALYTAGRAVTYVILGVLLVSSLVSAPLVSHFLQKYMSEILGPLLIIVGMVLLDLIRVGWMGARSSEGLQKRAANMGVWGAALLGMGFALAFCPVSAALFFGTVIPIAVETRSAVVVPTVYGIGTALPVFAFAFVISLSARSIGNAFNVVSLVDRWARPATGVVFIGVGVYLTLREIFHAVR